MQTPALAAQVHEIFGRGLDLYERLKQGEIADFRTEHGQLRKLLWADGEVAANPDYAGAMGNGMPARGSGMFDPDAAFLGARYALACWLDELFIVDSPWAKQWTESSMEVEVVGFGTQQRAWRFWRQAQRAATRPGTDALEVYLWCVMLGFRGEPKKERIDWVSWADGTRAHIIKTRNQRFPHEAGTNPRPDVQILTGQRQFIRMLRIGAVAVAAAAFFAGYWILKHKY
jgi:type VI secretion system protein ImpK